MTYQRKLKKNIKFAKNTKISRKNSIFHKLLMPKRRSTLPMHLSSKYEYRIEQGIKARNAHPLHLAIVIATISIMLIFIWWLNNSNAFYEPLTTDLTKPQTPVFDEFTVFSEIPDSVDSVDNIDSSEKTNALVKLNLPSVDNLLQSPSLQRLQMPENPALLPLKFQVQAGDNLSLIFDRYRLNRVHLYYILKLKEFEDKLVNLHPNQPIDIQRDNEGNVESLTLGLNFKEELHLRRKGGDDDRFTGEIRQRNIHKEIVTVQGNISNSLFVDAKATGLSPRLILEITNIFRWDIDFAHDIQVGDSFTIIYEKFSFKENKKDGKILAIEFVNQGKPYRAVYYTDKSGFNDYYTPSGNSLRKAFLRMPVPFARISSHFSTTRKHPILNRIRAHKGTDYAAKTGTPIMAAGDGKIAFLGRKNGYGKTIILEHHGNYSTLYAHLSNFEKGLKVGQRVQQEQIIGFVGQTGRATGPHLHFEFLENGEHHDPLTVKLPRSTPIPEEYKADFFEKTANLVAQLEKASEEELRVTDYESGDEKQN